MPSTCMKKIGRLWFQARRYRLNWPRPLRYMWREEKGIVFIRRAKEKENRILVHRQAHTTTREGEKIQEEGVGLDLIQILSQDQGRGQGAHDQGPFLSQNQARFLVLIHQEEGNHPSKQLFSFL